MALRCSFCFFAAAGPLAESTPGGSARGRRSWPVPDGRTLITWCGTRMSGWPSLSTSTSTCALVPVVIGEWALAGFAVDAMLELGPYEPHEVRHSATMYSPASLSRADLTSA